MHSFSVGTRIAVDDEPGRVVRANGLLARLLRPLEGGRERGVGALLRADDLDEREQRRRVEEVHADHALRMLGRLGDGMDRDRRGVRREDRVGPHEAVELGEHLALRLELLDDRLDHEIAVGQVGELGREATAGRASRRAPRRVALPFSTARPT